MNSKIKDPVKFLELFKEAKLMSSYKLKLISKVRPNIGKRTNKIKNGYRKPNRKNVKNIEEFMDLLDNQDMDILNSLRINDLTGKRVSNDTIIFTGSLRTPITMLWRVGKVKVPGFPKTYQYPLDPLILQAPHEGKDNTASSAVQIFEQTKAKVLLFNYIHPKLTNDSDGAHNVDTMFHKVHTKLEQMFPYAFFVQLHGWANTKFFMMNMNCYNNIFTRKHKSGPLLFARAGLQVYNEKQRNRIFFGDKGLQVHGYKRPGAFHNTCVQARHLNGGSQYDKGTEDKGRFMHVELGQRLIRPGHFPGARKNYENNIKKFSETLNLAMKAWIAENTDYDFDNATEDGSETVSGFEADTEEENANAPDNKSDVPNQDVPNQDVPDVPRPDNEPSPEPEIIINVDDEIISDKPEQEDPDEYDPDGGESYATEIMLDEIDHTKCFCFGF